ncbi:hypothetical protein Gotri_016534, partial [Gossypium trilobum]|nr:hypothetical protein [Gossypium trilobum]
MPKSDFAQENQPPAGSNSPKKKHPVSILFFLMVQDLTALFPVCFDILEGYPTADPPRPAAQNKCFPRSKKKGDRGFIEGCKSSSPREAAAAAYRKPEKYLHSTSTSKLNTESKQYQRKSSMAK